MRCILNTGRTREQGCALEAGKRTREYHDEVAVAFMNEDDIEELELQKNDLVKVSTEFGSVVVKYRKGWVDSGNIFMPLGPWANAVIGGGTSGTGMPHFKGAEVEVTKTEGTPTTLNDLLFGRAREVPLQTPAEPTAILSQGPTSIKDVVCPFCGCLCDDIIVTTDGGKIVGLEEIGCDVGRSKFLNHDKDRPKPAIRKNGKFIEVTLEEALNEAVGILKRADFPLIYGLSSTEVGAIRSAIELAELIGASIDNTATVCHGPTLVAAQGVGVPKCTLGEVKNRADLVIYWGCNPADAHIRHVTRYASMPEGLFTPDGRKGRVVIHVDVRETRTARVEPRWGYTYQVADMFIKVKPNQDYELLSALRAALKGHEVGDVAGVPSETIEKMVEKLKNCKFGVIFFGLGLTMSNGRHMNIDAALRLVRDLNDYTKFSILPMRGHFNVAGANEVMLWSTGYPFSVNFSRGYPIYSPGEFSAVDLLARGECDAALIIASDPVAHFPASASKHLAEIPTIVIDPKVNLTSMIAEVVIPCAMSGVECEGTAYRMDVVPIRLKKVVEPRYPPDKEILEMMIERVKT